MDAPKNSDLVVYVNVPDEDCKTELQRKILISIVQDYLEEAVYMYLRWLDEYQREDF